MEKIIRTAIYVVIGLFVLYEIIRMVITIYRNDRKNKAPVYTEHAVVFHKHKKNDIVFAGIHSSYVFYITFHTDFGQILKLYMTRDDFYVIEEGAAGQLTWQGDKLWKFIPDKKEEK